MAEGTFYVQTLFLADSGGARGEGSAAPLRLVQHAYARGAADQAPEDATVQQEHSYAVAEEGCFDCKPMRGGILQPCR